MARSRKPARRRRGTPKGDWVYRGGEGRDSIADQMGLASYHPGLNKTINAATSQASILYDSRNYLTQTVSDTVGTRMGSAARAEGRKARVLRVQGTIATQATTWTLGNTVRLGMRIGIFEQDANAGGISVDPDYRLFQTNAFFGGNAAVFANDRRSNQWTYFPWLHFATGNETSLRLHRINVAVRGYLEANDCLAFYIENMVGGVNINYWLALRTFVIDEG